LKTSRPSSPDIPPTSPFHQQCDDPAVAHVQIITSSRVGDIPIQEINTVMSSSIAAIQETSILGQSYAIPLLSFGLSVYHTDIQKLIVLKPDLILTCFQTAHGSILQGNLLDAAFHAVLGYSPQIVHCAAETLEASFQDMQQVADALHVSEKGLELVTLHRKRIEDAGIMTRGRSGPDRVLILQWPDPLYSAGAWVPQLIQMAGGRDALLNETAAQLVTKEMIERIKPDCIIFGFCGMHLKASAHAATMIMNRFKGGKGEEGEGEGTNQVTWWSTLPAVKSARVAVVDGQQIFSRPGPMLTQSVECLVEMFYSECQPFGHQRKLWDWLALQPS